MNKLAQRIFAGTLVLATVASISACSRTEERLTERTVVTPRDTAMTTDQAANERTVARGTATDLKTLQPGQPMGYYTRHFDDMGYQVMNIDRQNDRVVYDLGKGDTREQVTLFQNPGDEKVSRVETQKYTSVAANTQDKTVQSIKQQVSELPAGKNPVDYISSLSKLGTINEYKLHRDSATVDLESGKKHYKVRMDVNPDTQKVTDVNLDQNIWELPS